LFFISGIVKYLSTPAEIRSKPKLDLGNGKELRE
jgi:hypothetical protein